MKPDHVTPCRQFLHPGEVLWEAREYTEYPDLPLVPAPLRAPRKRSARKKGILGALGEVLDRASRPPSGTGESRPGGRLLDNRLVNSRGTRAVGTVAENLNEAQGH
ncbi:hypothetical protein CP981_24525 [Streptomyces platensis]|uniref:Uncharacterized protein n=1 Tax=Streptomyces platensis TaxID=58346 RepID=A0AAE6NJM9_STRPT|nr:hypothetical protein [Streptomyces platensis]OSY45626.1 hypothetical protein BG653_02916 [Streptomyces platensis]QEV54369.1 hypothetical protein CP981_24525 [Streptomyces platensis]